MIDTVRHSGRSGFTLIELIVSVTILLILISAVGLVFRSASNSVGVSEATMDVLSNANAVERRLARDVGGMDKTAFLVVRCGIYADSSNPSQTVYRRCDQIAFIAHGNFPNRSGANSSSHPFTDSGAYSSTALIWWGQLATVSSTATGATKPTDPRTFLADNQGYQVPLNQVPTGLVDSDFILGRTATLLVAQDGTTSYSYGGSTIPAYLTNTTLTPPVSGIDYYIGNVAAASESTAANITESRVLVAATPLAQVVDNLKQAISNAGGRAAAARYEADHFCYRHAALRSPFDSSIGVANGYFRMAPIALQGVSSLAIDWTDGQLFTGSGTEMDVVSGNSVQAGSALVNTTKWYGIYNDPHGNVTGISSRQTAAPYQATMVDYGTSSSQAPIVTNTQAVNGDYYTAIFTYDSPSNWPTALRFRYHIADPSGRLPSGRDVVTVVKLP